MLRIFSTLALSLTLATACTTPTPSPDPDPAEATTTDPATGGDVEGTDARRAFAPTREGEPVISGVSYGPFRAGQRPGGPDPTDAQILEDLQIVQKDWGMIRVYSSRGPTEAILRTIRDESIPLVVMVGAWIAPDDPEANAAEVAEAIRLANAYPEQVVAVSVGNESQVYWSGHRCPPELVLGHIREVRAAVEQPVTTADDYNFWNKPESRAFVEEIDFIVLHAYAMWNQQSLADAVPWTASVVESIEQAHPGVPIVMGETGWATELNPQGDEIKYIKAPAGEAEQAAFYDAFTAWAAREKQPYFYFEAFDEPWKGSEDPREVEKHWGVYNEDRTPKAAMKPR
jgi:exo-beta-1,3-glucanase (GH17 family)